MVFYLKLKLYSHPVMNRLSFSFLIIYLLPIVFVYSQENESGGDYSDYSYLWADDTKKKKKKKEKKKDQIEDNTSSTELPLVDKDSTTNEYQVSDYDTPQQQEPAVEEEVLDEIEDDNQEEKIREPKERVPIDDFRAPLTPAGQGGSFTGGFTYTTIGDEAFVGMVLSPEFTIGKVGLGLNVPILYGLDSKSVRTEIFKDGVGPARLIRYIRYGNQKQDPLYLKIGQLDGTMIGYGGLVNNYSNATSFEKRKVGLHFDVNWKGFAGVEGMYSDFNPASQNLLAIRPYVRPLAFTAIPIVSTFEVGATLLSDKDQTDFPTSDSTSTSYVYTSEGVKAVGFDAGLTLLKVPFIQIDLFANYSSLNVSNDSLDIAAQSILQTDDFKSGSGMSVGLNFRFHFVADVFSTDLRIERLNYKDHYQPQFFDAVYELNKDAKLLSLISAEKKKGIYGSLTGHVLQKVIIGGSLMIPDDISDRSPAVVRVHADMERLADKFSFHGSYIKGNLSDLGDAFSLDERSLAKLRFIYHMNKFLATGIDYYYAFTQVDDGSYKVTKTVMPYFGVSISF